ncbi:MAG: phosphotransferase family protein, partial [Deltaproteobacteria bacterium]
AGPEGLTLAPRIAEALHKLHLAGIAPHRRHTLSDELRILDERLAVVARQVPAWGGRIQRILAACHKLGAAVPEAPSCGIHRDFYADQIIVDRDRLYLLDFDLYCKGNPALDVGNFLGHLAEQSVRTLSRPDALADREQALLTRYAELAGEAAASVRVYAILTLIRHIAVSMQFPVRRPFTELLMNLGEELLGIAQASSPLRC